jgi:predicted dehydrogenase
MKLSAAATAAAAVTARPAFANDRIAIGVIGCRNRGHQVASNYIRTGQFDLVALCDCDDAMIDRGRAELSNLLEGKPEPDRIKDFRDLLARQDVDAVAIATPDHWHAAMTQLALDAGKHVMVEKPASFNIVDGRAMVAAAKQHPELVVQVGTQQRSGPHFQAAREFIQSGALGQIGFCRAWVTHTRGRVKTVPDGPPPATLDYDMWLGPAPMVPYNDETVHYNWRFMKDWGTGEMGNWGAHWIDIARWYLGLDLPTGVSGTGGTFVMHDAKQWPDTQTVLYEFPNLTMLWEQRLWTSHAVNGNGTGVEFGGENGTLIVTRSWWRFYPRDGEMAEHRGSGQELPHAQNFAQTIRGEAENMAPMEDGHKTAVVCHLGNLAVELNRHLAFDPETESFPGDEEANAYRGRPYRAPWTLPA